MSALSFLLAGGVEGKKADGGCPACAGNTSTFSNQTSQPLLVLGPLIQIWLLPAEEGRTAWGGGVGSQWTGAQSVPEKKQRMQTC